MKKNKNNLFKKNKMKNTKYKNKIFTPKKKPDNTQKNKKKPFKTPLSPAGHKIRGLLTLIKTILTVSCLF